MKAANLNGLPSIFYNRELGLNLVLRDGQKYILNTDAEIAKEVLDHLNKEHSYGSKDTRRARLWKPILGGLGYGGDLDMSSWSYQYSSERGDRNILWRAAI